MSSTSSTASSRCSGSASTPYFPRAVGRESCSDSWFDQQRDLEALRAVLAEGSADAIADSVIGPAYIASAALVHTAHRSEPRGLPRRTRSHLLRAVDRRWPRARARLRPPHDVGASVRVSRGTVRLRRSRVRGGTWYWSDVPWSHFFAAFLGVTLLVLRFAPVRVGPVASALIGAVIALLALTRTFELVALLLAWLIGLALLWLLQAPATEAAGPLAAPLGRGRARRDGGRRLRRHRQADAFFLYGNHLDRQSGAVQVAEVAETPTFGPRARADQARSALRRAVLLLVVSRRRLRRRRRPGAAHSPRRVVGAGAAVAAPAGHTASGARVPPALPPRRRGPRRLVRSSIARERRCTSASSGFLLEMTIAATGIDVGYAASTMTGSPHLRYGFARDFLLPATLTGDRRGLSRVSRTLARD